MNQKEFRKQAIALDEKDPLKSFRNEFEHPLHEIHHHLEFPILFARKN